MIGSGANGELTAIDILNVLSFIIGLKNLDLNIDQNDMDNQTQEIDKILEVLQVENHQETFKND